MNIRSFITLAMAKRIPALLTVFLVAPCVDAQPTFRVISNLNGYDQPGGLLEGSPGVFFSEASVPGSSNQLAFSVTAQGVTTTLASFQNEYMESLLVSASNGRFYSCVEPSGQLGSVFSVGASAGTPQVYPTQSLVPAFSQNLPNGNLLGAGADASSTDHVVVAGLDGTVTSVFQFPTNQVLPTPVIYASDDNYYGVEEDELDSAGYAYRVTPSGTMTPIYTFASGTFRGYSTLPLLQADDGDLYGATIAGGANGFGSIYKLTLAGQYTLLHSFPKGKGAGGPTSLIQASDGNLYGAAQDGEGFGYIFRITKSGDYSNVYAMNNGADGLCPCWLLQGSDGAIYGMAHAGGSVGGGAFFSLNLGLRKPRPWAKKFGPQSGPPGTRVRIWGTNLLSATVSFNGVAGTAVSNSGSNYIWVTVPSGATSGPITVTTPGGSNTTSGVFTVQ